MRRLAPRMWMVFVLFALLAALFGVFPGTWFEDDITRDAQWLVTTYAVVATVLALAIAPTAFRRGERWAWVAFWIWPAFFVVHGVVVFVVDFVFAAPGRIRATDHGPAKSGRRQVKRRVDRRTALRAEAPVFASTARRGLAHGA